MNDFTEDYYYSDHYQFKDIERITKLLSKQPKKVDEKVLKMAACSHIETDTFILANGFKMIQCKACGMWKSDAPTPEEWHQLDKEEDWFTRQTEG